MNAKMKDEAENEGSSRDLHVSEMSLLDQRGGSGALRCIGAKGVDEQWSSEGVDIGPTSGENGGRSDSREW